jgi:tRNA dimethylallyltransferase
LNLDVFQMVKGFDVGTAKPTRDDQCVFSYGFLDVCEPGATVDAQWFGESARQLIAEAQSQGKVVVAVGGSGLYLRSLLHGLDELPARDDEIRGFIRSIAQVQGSQVVYNWLLRLDPVRAAQLHPRDLVRVERALEIFLSTGRPSSTVATRRMTPQGQPRLFPAYVVMIDRPMEELSVRIVARTRSLLKQQGGDGEGPWIKEVRALLGAHGSRYFDLPACRAIGYEAIGRAVERSGDVPLSESCLAQLCDRIVTLTRQYARRQRTWMGTAAVDLRLADEVAISAFASDFAMRNS